MGSRSGSESGHMAQAAHRLRSLQEELSGRPQEERRALLIEELETTMARVLPAQRRAFFDALLARFPSWDELVPAPGHDVAMRATAVPAHAGGAADDPDVLVERLIEAMKSLDERRRARVRDRLRAEGIVEVADGAANHTPGDLPPALQAAARRALHLPPDARLNAASIGRVVTVLSKLLAFAEKLDHTARRTRAELTGGTAPEQPTSELRAAGGRYVAEGRSAAKIELVDRIEHARRLISVLLTSSERVSRLAQQMVDRLSPQSIEAAADRPVSGRKGSRKGGPGGPGAVGGRNRGFAGLLHGREVLLWRTYREIATALGGGAIDREIRDELSRYIKEYAPMRPPLRLDSDETTA